MYRRSQTQEEKSLNELAAAGQTTNTEVQTGRQQINVDADERLDSIKYRKAIAKTAFTKAKNQVLRLLGEIG
jgi:hypothetical protein